MTLDGDSGGPLFIVDGDRFVQIAITQSSAGTGYPGVFVMLDQCDILNFIRKEVFDKRPIDCQEGNTPAPVELDTSCSCIKKGHHRNYLF